MGSHVTTPCAKCGEPTVRAMDEAGRSLILDATVRGYHVEFDPEQRVEFWIRAEAGLCRVLHAEVCKGRQQ